MLDKERQDWLNSLSNYQLFQVEMGELVFNRSAWKLLNDKGVENESNESDKF